MTERYLAPVRNRRSRDMEALRLRSRGWTIDQIAEHLAFTGSNPSKAAATAIKRAAAKLVRFPADEVKLLELESLDELESIQWSLLRQQHVMVNARGVVYDETGSPVQDDRIKLEIMDRIMKIKERRARMLGLDAPSRSEVITIDVIDREIAQLEKELKRRGNDNRREASTA